MRAVILAAGKGERLKDVAPGLPKPMIRFRGKPLLEHNIDLCKRHGITELFINTHLFPEIVHDYFGDGSNFGVTIRYSFEETLLGTSGAVKNFEGFLRPDPFFVLYGDNYSDYDLPLLEQIGKQKAAIAVIGFHWREDTSSSGVAEFAADGRITRFVEKPKPDECQSHWVNAGIYYLRPEIIDSIPTGFSDFAKDVFPKLLHSGTALYGLCRKSDVRAFDTPDMYNRSIDS